jgi:hypothetical protein
MQGARHRIARAPLLADQGQHEAVRLEVQLGEDVHEQVGRQRQNRRVGGRAAGRVLAQPQRQRLPLARAARAARAVVGRRLAQPDVAPRRRQRPACSMHAK